MTQIMAAAQTLKVGIAAMEQILPNTKLASIQQDLAPVLGSQFRFPVDFTTLPPGNADGANTSDDDGDDANDDDDDGFRRGQRVQKRKKRNGSPRMWTSQDRQRLGRMKRKGWSDARIGQGLGRSASAVSQQWRKQK